MCFNWFIGTEVLHSLAEVQFSTDIDLNSLVNDQQVSQQSVSLCDHFWWLPDKKHVEKYGNDTAKVTWELT